MPNFGVKFLLKMSARVKCVPNSMSASPLLPLLLDLAKAYIELSLAVWYRAHLVSLGSGEVHTKPLPIPHIILVL